MPEESGPHVFFIGEKEQQKCFIYGIYLAHINWTLRTNIPSPAKCPEKIYLFSAFFNPFFISDIQDTHIFDFSDGIFLLEPYRFQKLFIFA